ncbi:MAG: sigma-70 family RNA polymerase sigma factor [Porphyromonadaceae bacterium]|nr:sigma-70 family RNA polymerase sigma factor [uncultured Macellibacteroides sp.]MCE5225563.1 sigma-70 family RNA polymerase sigma factor [Porphyromonadaceae bacterium]
MNNTDLEKAFIGMIQQNERVIYKVCSFYISEDSTLGDLYQDVVSNLWVAYPKFRNESAVSTWIYRIALNTCISGIRKEMRKPQRVSFSQLSDVFEQPEDMSAEIKELYRLIHQLKIVERAIILLYLEEKSYQQIADIVGLTVSNVAVKLKRIKEKLVDMSNH